MKVTEKCFTIWDYLNRRRRYAYSQAEIRKGLQRNEELKKDLRGITAKEVLGALSLLDHNNLVKRIATPKGVYWRIPKGFKGDWPKVLNKKHGGYIVC